MYHNFTYFPGMEISWKHKDSAEFLQGNCALTQNFHTRKSGEVSVFYGQRTTGATSLGPWQIFMIEFLFYKKYFSIKLYFPKNIKI